MSTSLTIKRYDFPKIPKRNFLKKDIIIWCGDDETVKAIVRQEKSIYSNIIVESSKLANKGFIDRNKLNKLKIAFIPSNDTHVKTYSELTKYIHSYCIFNFKENNENSRKFCEKYSLNSKLFTEKALKRYRPDIVVFSNDWGSAEKTVILWCNKNNIPTVCLQEGPLDFTDPVSNRMRYASFAFIQGPVTLKYLKRGMYFICGNPRIDSLKINRNNHIKKVLINLNFTYGIFEDYRDKWLKSVVKACNKTGLPFFISQHPRDSGKYPELPVVNSNASKITEQLNDCTIVISRFSTLIYEAVFRFKDVIYYNPHKEQMEIFNEDNSGGIEKAYSYKQLFKSLLKLKSKKIDKKNTDEFKINHCSYVGKDAIDKTLSAFEIIPQIYKYLQEIHYEDPYNITEKGFLHTKLLEIIRSVKCKIIQS